VLIPWWMGIYVVLFGLIIVLNLCFHVKYKLRLPILLYEFISAIYMIFLIFAYWTPGLNTFLTFFNIFAFLLIISIDFYLTIWAETEDFGLKMPALTDAEYDIAKSISILLASPAYITGLLLCVNVCI